MACKTCGHDAINHFILGTKCNVKNCDCMKTQSEVMIDDELQTVRVLALIEGESVAKEEVEKLQKKLKKAIEALKEVEHIYWNFRDTKTKRCPCCGSSEGTNHAHDTDCLIYQVLKDGK